MARKFKLKENTEIIKCPMCGNNTDFVAHSKQCAEDACEVWVECKCGYDPTSWENKGSLYRFEDVWGGTDNGNCLMALDVWNDLVSGVV